MGKLNLIMSDEGPANVIDGDNVYEVTLPGKSITIKPGPNDKSLIMTVDYLCLLKPLEEPVVDFEPEREEPRF